MKTLSCSAMAILCPSYRPVPLLLLLLVCVCGVLGLGVGAGVLEFRRELAEFPECERCSKKLQSFCDVSVPV